MGIFNSECYRAHTGRKKMADAMSTETENIKERFLCYELEIELDAMRKPLIIKQETE